MFLSPRLQPSGHYPLKMIVEEKMVWKRTTKMIKGMEIFFSEEHFSKEPLLQSQELQSVGFFQAIKIKTIKQTKDVNNRTKIHVHQTLGLYIYK